MVVAGDRTDSNTMITRRNQQQARPTWIQLPLVFVALDSARELCASALSWNLENWNNEPRLQIGSTAD